MILLIAGIILVISNLGLIGVLIYLYRNLKHFPRRSIFILAISYISITSIGFVLAFIFHEAEIHFLCKLTFTFLGPYHLVVTFLLYLDCKQLVDLKNHGRRTFWGSS